MRDNREDLTLPASIYWNCVLGSAVWRVTAPRWLWPPEELAALSEGVGSSSASGVINLRNDWVVPLVLHDSGDGSDEGIGASTKALASAKGRSSTMAMSCATTVRPPTGGDLAQ